MKPKISSTTLSNLRNSSMVKRVDQQIEKKDHINIIFPHKDSDNSDSLQPNASGSYSDSKTENLFGNQIKLEMTKSFENNEKFRSYSSSEEHEQKSDQSFSNNYQRPSLKKWRSISIMFKSIRGFQENEAMKLESIESLDKIMEKFETPKAKDKKKNYRKTKSRFENALDHLLDIEKMIDCAERGGRDDLEIIRSIVEKDPKKLFNIVYFAYHKRDINKFLIRYLISSKDPEHLINNKNRFGQTALYSACKNGHINVVRYLLENDANPFLKIKLEEGLDESPLEVATRWGHVEVIECLLDNVDYSEKELKICFTLAMTSEIKNIFAMRLRLIQINETLPKKIGFLDNFLSYFCC